MQLRASPCSSLCMGCLCLLVNVTSLGVPRVRRLCVMHALSTILVVDDEADIRTSLRLWFTGLGYEVLTAEHGRDALRQLRACARLPSLILLDMMMPIMDGLSFRWEQLADPVLATIPVIILSASDYCHASAAELGAAGSFQKPCPPEQLLEAVEQLCGHG